MGKASRIGKMPPFIKKLLLILEQPSSQDLIDWLPDQNGFHILNVARFTQIVLPKYYKHQNMASFVRQLNIYGFNRTKNSQQHVYVHPKFKKGHINMIKNIHRKNATEKKFCTRSEKNSLSDCSQSHPVKQSNEQQEVRILKSLHAQNRQLKKINDNLRKTVKQHQIFKKKIQNFFYENKQKSESEKNQKQQGSTSGSDKSDTKPPFIQLQNLKIVGSSFGFCQNFIREQQKKSYMYLINGNQDKKQ